MQKTATIVTSEESFQNNYGAALQGYALYTTLKELHFNPQIIRYQGGQFQDNLIKYYLYRIKRRIGLIVHYILPPDKERQARSLRKANKDKIKARNKLFVEFQTETMTFYNKRRMTWPQLAKNHPKTDVYICGSDQIWNPYFKREFNDPGYFLAFAPQNAKKIAYAPSFGCDDLPDKAKKTLKTYLKDFNAISIREKSGVEIISEYAGRKAEHVLDPTMLILPEQWKQIAKLPQGIPEKYILTYRFADSLKTKLMIDRIAKKTGFRVLSIPLSVVAMKDDYQMAYEVGPKEFVGLIENASLVCTDSFHATVFSILMKTPVCVFLREDYISGGSMNSRVLSLMEMFSLKDNIIFEDDTVIKAMNCLKTDYTYTHQLLREYRNRSLQFLKKALEE